MDNLYTLYSSVCCLFERKWPFCLQKRLIFTRKSMTFVSIQRNTVNDTRFAYH